MIESINKSINLYDDKGEWIGFDKETRKRCDHAFFDIFVDMSKRDPGLLFIPSNAGELFYTAQEMLMMNKLPYRNDWRNIKLPDKKWIYEAATNEKESWTFEKEE